MNENEENNFNPVEKIQETKQDIETAKKLAAKIETGNWIGAAKDLIGKLKDKKTRKRYIRKIAISIAMKLLPILIASILALGLFGALNSMKDKMVDLIGMAASKVGGFFSNAWQWLTNDYWTDINEKFEYIVDANTGETLGTPETIKNTYVDDNGNIVDAMGNKYDQDGNMLDKDGKIRETITKSYTLVDQYVRELGNNGISIKELRLLGDANYGDKTIEELLEDKDSKELMEKYIAEFIRADIITQQPHRNKTKDVVKPDNQNLVDGGVYFYRNKKDAELKEEDFTKGEYNKKGVEVDEKDYKRMTYLEPEEFVKELGKEGADVSELYTSGEVITTDSKSKGENLRYKFTIDPKTENIVLLEIKATTTKESETTDGWFQNISEWFQETISSETHYEMKLVEKDYKSVISKYSMPYEFLINLCEITQNPEFVYHVALLARDTKITLVIQDNTDQIIETSEIEEDYEKWENHSGADTAGASLTDSRTERKRKIITTTTHTPVLRQYSADTWSFYEEFKYTKDIEGTLEDSGIHTTKQGKPSTLPNYVEGHYEEQYTRKR